MKKKFLAVVLSAVMAGSMCAFAACNGGDKAEKQAYVSLDINPAIELIVDKNNNVVSVRGENEDGQVLLYQETEIKGEKIDKAIKKITDLAIKYGYLDESNKVVDTIVSSGDNAFAEEISKKVKTTITATAEGLGLSVTTDSKGAYSLLRQMEEVKKQFPNNKAIQNMTVAKFKLALSVSETGDISIDAAIALDDAKLIEMQKQASQKIEEFATTAYLEAKAKALAVYEQAILLASYGVYSQFYMERIITHPLTAYYGGVYQMYASAAKGFEMICDVAEFAANIKKYPLNEAQINAIVTALGMESAEPLKNSKGEITIESIEAYADKLFKNTPESEQLEEMKAALTAALKQIETTVKEEVGKILAQYKPQIEQALKNAREIIDSVSKIMSSLPESIQSVIKTSIAELKNILDEIDRIISGEKIDLEVLRKQANRLQEKATEYLDKIKADLTEEEWAELEARRTAAIERMTEQKKAFEKALNKAENEAKDYLAQLKELRKPNNNPTV